MIIFRIAALMFFGDAIWGDHGTSFVYSLATIKTRDKVMNQLNIGQEMATDTEIQAVQRTFELIMPIADTFTAMFYTRFFTENPTIRPLFKTDMASQRQKVIGMLALAVRGLDEPQTMLRKLDALGQRHVTYHVEPEHYIHMNAAILATLTDFLGENFTDVMRNGWVKALNLLTTIMLKGSAQT